MSGNKRAGMGGSVMEPMSMARWHLLKALERTTREDMAERTGLSKSTLSNIQYGLCEFVPVGTTKKFREIAKELIKQDQRNPWKEFLEDDEVRSEVAKLRAMNPKVTRIRHELAEKAAGRKKKVGK